MTDDQHSQQRATIEVTVTLEVDVARWVDEHGLEHEPEMWPVDVYDQVVAGVADRGRRSGLYTVEEYPRTDQGDLSGFHRALVAPNRLRVFWDVLVAAAEREAARPADADLHVAADEARRHGQMVAGYARLVGVPRADVETALALGAMVPILPAAYSHHGGTAS